MRTLTTPRIMQLAMLACLPGLFALIWFFGWGYLINVLWLGLLALLLEAAILKLRGRALRPRLMDCSALVTALLLALSLPPTAPWWIGLVGIFFAIGVAKHLYGGLGHNPFNPAMAAYAVLLLSFPLEMTRWIMPLGAAPAAPGLADSLRQIFIGAPAGFDAFVGATALDEFKLQRGGMLASEFRAQNVLFGAVSGRGWEWANLGFLLGGLMLLHWRVISWHIPLAALLSLGLLAAFFYDGGSSASHGSPLLHLFGGATMLGAFFIATDPVTAATTPLGKLIYGALVGALIFCIRAWGAYPDGVAFAVLLGNFAAPAIDAFVQGEKREG